MLVIDDLPPDGGPAFLEPVGEPDALYGVVYEEAVGAAPATMGCSHGTTHRSTAARRTERRRGCKLCPLGATEVSTHRRVRSKHQRRASLNWRCWAGLPPPRTRTPLPRAGPPAEEKGLMPGRGRVRGHGRLPRLDHLRQLLGLCHGPERHVRHIGRRLDHGRGLGHAAAAGSRTCYDR